MRRRLTLRIGLQVRHDAPDVVIRQPQRRHRSTRNAVLNGVEEGILTEPDEAAISDQRRVPGLVEYRATNSGAGAANVRLLPVLSSLCVRR